MARMVPDLDEERLDELKSAAEADFYRACRDQLDEQVLVIHSLALVRLTAAGSREDAEADFGKSARDKASVSVGHLRVRLLGRYRSSECTARERRAGVFRGTPVQAYPCASSPFERVSLGRGEANRAHPSASASAACHWD